MERKKRVVIIIGIFILFVIAITVTIYIFVFQLPSLIKQFSIIASEDQIIEEEIDEPIIVTPEYTSKIDGEEISEEEENMIAVVIENHTQSRSKLAKRLCGA